MSDETNDLKTNCWAAALGGCDHKISREHIVSQCLFETDHIMVQGFTWCLNEPRSVGLKNLVAKILCKAHNSQLSELDSAALAAFDVFREAIRLNQVRGKIKKPAVWNVKRLKIDGPRLERWFLKTLINVGFQGQWRIGEGSHAVGTPSPELVQIAFGHRSFQKGAGLYLAARAGEQIDSMDRVRVTTMTDTNNLTAGRFNFRGYTFFLNLVQRKFDKFGDSNLLHQKATINCQLHNRLSHVISITGW